MPRCKHCKGYFPPDRMDGLFCKTCAEEERKEEQETKWKKKKISKKKEK